MVSPRGAQDARSTGDKRKCAIIRRLDITATGSEKTASGPDLISLRHAQNERFTNEASLEIEPTRFG
jgi:hypothetical protein